MLSRMICFTLSDLLRGLDVSPDRMALEKDQAREIHRSMHSSPSIHHSSPPDFDCVETILLKGHPARDVALAGFGKP
jgi:hypothetical protein